MSYDVDALVIQRDRLMAERDRLAEENVELHRRLAVAASFVRETKAILTHAEALAREEESA